MNILISLLTVILLTSSVFAQDVSVVDNSTISVSNPPTTISISDLKSQLANYQERVSFFQDKANKVQGQLDSAAIKGASDAVAVASPDVQASIAKQAKPVDAQPIQAQPASDAKVAI